MMHKTTIILIATIPLPMRARMVGIPRKGGRDEATAEKVAAKRIASTIATRVVVRTTTEEGMMIRRGIEKETGVETEIGMKKGTGIKIGMKKERETEDIGNGNGTEIEDTEAGTEEGKEIATGIAIETEIEIGTGIEIGIGRVLLVKGTGPVREKPNEGATAKEVMTIMMARVTCVQRNAHVRHLDLRPHGDSQVRPATTIARRAPALHKKPTWPSC